jgi:uncharacterized protein (TIGR00730 family)
MSEDKDLPGPEDSLSLGDEGPAIKVLEDSVMRLWDVVNNLTRLRPSNRGEFHVTIFGSARIQPDHWVYEAVRDLAAELAKMGCGIVTGGGPGLMQAANEGAAMAGPEAKERSMGIRVHLPFEQGVNPFVGQVFEHRTFFSRLHHFVMVSEAFVVLPGGIGTTLELMMVWQLLQVRKIKKIPLILLGDMWEELVEWSKKYMLQPEFQMANKEDLLIPQCVKTAEETITLIRSAHEEWGKMEK